MQLNCTYLMYSFKEYTVTYCSDKYDPDNIHITAYRADKTSMISVVYIVNLDLLVALFVYTTIELSLAVVFGRNFLR